MSEENTGAVGMADEVDISEDRLKEILNYNPETGIFTNLITRGAKALAGSTAGWKNDRGYLKISIDCKIYLVHRLAWFYMTGKWPKKHLDHVNGQPSDNRFCNLREATNAENARNSGLQKNNQSGFKGVHWNRVVSKWQAKIYANGEVCSLGFFSEPEPAAGAYDAAALEHYGEFAKTNKMMGLLPA